MPSWLDEKTAATALIGLFAGWLLTVLSSGVKFWWERRKAHASVLYSLFPAYLRIHVVIDTIDRFQESSNSPEEFERVRSGIVERHGDVFSRVKGSSLEKYVEELAPYSPMLSVEAMDHVELINRLLKIRLPAAAQASPELYINLLSLNEVALEQATEKFRSFILKLAVRTSALTWLYAYFRLKKVDKRNESSANDLVTKAMAPAFSVLKDMK